MCQATGWFVLSVTYFSGLCVSYRHYILVNELKTWNESQTYCRDRYTDLATVDDMTDMERLTAAAGSGFSGRVWIGLYDVWWSWTWSLTDDHLYGAESDFSNWYATEPMDPRNQWDVCGATYATTWHDLTCHGPCVFVCYNNTNTALPVASTRRYIYVSDPLTWHEAQAYCRKYHTDLASVRTEAENQVLQQVVPQGILVLIGLRRDTWMWWSDGSRHNFTYWVSGYPGGKTGNCAVSIIDSVYKGRLIEHDCATKFPFMCYGIPRKIFRIRLGSTVNLEDPAVWTAMLELMKQKMAERGITDFNITWTVQG